MKLSEIREIAKLASSINPDSVSDATPEQITALFKCPELLKSVTGVLLTVEQELKELSEQY